MTTKEALAELWVAIKRFRTWVFNILAALVVVLPDIIAGLASNNWNGIIPAHYMPYVTAAIIVVNVLLRPRPAAVKEKAGG